MAEERNGLMTIREYIEDTADNPSAISNKSSINLYDINRVYVSKSSEGLMQVLAKRHKGQSLNSIQKVLALATDPDDPDKDENVQYTGEMYGRVTLSDLRDKNKITSPTIMNGEIYRLRSPPLVSLSNGAITLPLSNGVDVALSGFKPYKEKVSGPTTPREATASKAAS